MVPSQMGRIDPGIGGEKPEKEKKGVKAMLRRGKHGRKR